MERYLKNFEECMERDIPYCQGHCPFDFNIFDFMEKAKRGAASAAFKVYRNAVGFPNIANELCHQPCKEVCPRSDFGGSVEMSFLEKSSVRLTKDTSPTEYNLPMKKERIAIIGAGITGMAALLRLSTKKYHVEIFEKKSKIGGRLHQSISPKTIEKDFKEQLIHQEYTLHFNRKISSLDDFNWKDFNAVFVASGKDGIDLGLKEAVSAQGDMYCKEIDGVGFFAGGGVIGQEGIFGLAAGLNIGAVIDNYLKTGFMYYPKHYKKDVICEGIVKVEDFVPAIESSSSYTMEQFKEEASRCLECSCEICKQGCDLIDFTEKMPVKIRDEILATTLEGKSELKSTPAKRLMSLCNQCGICKRVCPKEIDLDGMFMAGRAKMHKQGKMPWAFHDFWLDDMEFSNSEMASIIKPASKGDTKYAFFPGCQIGSSAASTVEATYRLLVESVGNVGLILRCCGVPALWAGDEQKHKEELAEIEKAWEEMGRPIILLACPNCIKIFKESLPQINVMSVYEKIASLDKKFFEIAEKTIVSKRGRHEGKSAEIIYRIFDPCTTTDDKGIQKIVRDVALFLGINPSDEGTEQPRCCSFGGHGSIANPKYAEFVIKKRVDESPLPYITYCINCRDSFRVGGKEAYHILEILTGNAEIHQSRSGDEADGNKGAYKINYVPTVTERRDNRILLKEKLLKEFWDEDMEKTLLEKEKINIDLKISLDIEEKLNKERILHKEVAEVIEFCERTGRTVYHKDKGFLTGYKEIGHTTLWVQYRKEDTGSFEILNGYMHRTKIDLEAVWNGKKRETE